MRFGQTVLLLVLSVLPLFPTVFATSVGDCSLFAEDFSGLSANSWSGGSGNWYFQSEALHVDQITAGNMAFAETSFFPGDFFSIDVEIQLHGFPSGAAVGIVPFGSSDVFLPVGNRTTDGLGVMYLANGRAHLFGWDLDQAEWFITESYHQTGSTPSSIGVAYDESQIVLRVNGQNTAVKVSGNFSLAPSVLDTLWLVAQGAGTHVSFDNICADPLSSTPVDNPPTVSISSPSNGSTVSQTVTVQASASDDKGVAKVEFSIDGVKKGTDTSAPYRYSWDTTAVANGSHTILAKAFDTTNQTAQAQVTVTVSNGSVQPMEADNVYYFPFCQAEGGNFTGFAVSNYSSSPAQVQFTPYSSGGSPAYSPSQFNLEPQHQLGKLSNELFGQPAGSRQSLWIEMATDNPEVGSFFQFGAANQMDGSVPFTQAYSKLYFTRVFQGSTAYRGQAADTWLSIANPTTQAVTVQLRLYANGSSSPTTKSRTIPGKGFLYETVGSLFGQNAVSSGYIVAEVSGEGGIIGFELVKLTSKKTVIGLGAQPAGTAMKLYSAQLASLTGFYTNVKLVNTSGQSLQVTLRATDEAGNNLASAVTRTISAGGVLEEDASDLFGFGGGQVAIGSLTIEANRAGMVGDVVFGDAAKFTTAAALPLQTETLTRGIFSQVANVSGLFTGVALFNPGSQPAEATVQVYSVTGQKTGEKSLTLQPGARISKLLTDSDFIPSTAGQVGGYVDVRSSQPLIAQQLFGSASLLSAVPPKTGDIILGESGISISLPNGARDFKASVAVSNGQTSAIVESGETAVSAATVISIEGEPTITGGGPFEISIPVTKSNADPTKLRLKVKLNRGEVLPVYGDYDTQRKVFSTVVYGLADGWVMGVVEGRTHRIQEIDEVENDFRGWETPLAWQTHKWVIIDEMTNTADSQTIITNEIKPVIQEVGQELEQAGFRSPKLWIDAKKGGRHLYVVDRGNFSYYQPCPDQPCNEDDPNFALGTLTEHEKLLLGRVYIDYRHFKQYYEQRDVTMGFLISHELFHAVQAGYDYRQAYEKGFEWGDGNKDTWGSASAFEEGTANVIGMTYQKNNGNLSPRNVGVTHWQTHQLDKPIDDFKSSSPYAKQDFFAFLAKRYFPDIGAGYIGSLWNALGKETRGVYKQTGETYRNLYRKALNDVLQNLASVTLPEAYFEYAFERLYNHDSKYFLRSEGDDSRFTPRKLSKELVLSPSGVGNWVADASGKFQRLVLNNLGSLASSAVHLEVPPASRGTKLPIRISLLNGQVKSDLKAPGVAILIIREKDEVALPAGQNASIVVTDISQPIEVPTDQGVTHLTILIMNCYVEDRKISAQFKIGGGLACYLDFQYNSGGSTKLAWYPFPGCACLGEYKNGKFTGCDALITDASGYSSGICEPPSKYQYSMEIDFTNDLSQITNFSATRGSFVVRGNKLNRDPGWGWWSAEAGAACQAVTQFTEAPGFTCSGDSYIHISCYETN